MKRINLMLSDSESRNLELLIGKYGGKATGFLRTLLKQAFEKEYGGYKEKSVKGIIDPEDELTPEQVCEKAGGKVVTREGIQVCEFQYNNGGFVRTIPIGRPELFPKPQ